MIKRFNGAVSAKRACLILLLTATALGTTGCAVVGGSGPSAGSVQKVASNPAGSPVYLVDLDPAMASAAKQAQVRTSFLDRLGNAQPVGSVIGSGDALTISIWEAPPAALFGSAPTVTRGTIDTSATALGGGTSTMRTASFPDQVVGADGTVSVPFAGRIPVLGRSTQDVEREIIRRLQGKAHLPQVMVAFARNATSTATVIGEVSKSGMVMLTAKGERVLDALAFVGGTREPINKMTIQLSRGGIVETMPMESIIRDPRQNVILMPGDIVSAYYQPLSFTALGATGANKEIPFESTGLTLAQALGRAGGLDDQRANPSGAFIFRFEDARTLGIDPANPVRNTAKGPVPIAVDAQGRVAVIYRINLKDPTSFFAAQDFPIRDRDVLYVSNAPLAEIQKFVSLISATVFPILSLQTAFAN